MHDVTDFSIILFVKRKLEDTVVQYLNTRGFRSVETVTGFLGIRDRSRDRNAVIVYDWIRGSAHEVNAVHNVLDIWAECNTQVIFVIDRGITEAVKLLGQHRNLKFVFRPLHPRKLEAALKSIVMERTRTSSVSVEYINPFILATSTTFAELASVELKKKKLTIDKGLNIRGDLSGVMFLSGNATGFALLSMEERGVKNLIKKMTGDDNLEEQVVDSVVMELINIISGKAQAIFDQNEYEFEFTTPSLIRGKDHSVRQAMNDRSIVVEFETDSGDKVFLQICLTETRKAESETASSAGTSGTYSFEKEYKDTYCLIRPKGDFGFRMLQDIRPTIDEVLNSECSHMTFDLADTRTIDSTGLGFLVNINKKFLSKNGRVHLVVTTPAIRDILQTTQIAGIFGVHKSIEEAEKAIAVEREAL